MRSAARTLALAAALVAALPAIELLASPPAPFTLAVVRRDGVVIPFADYAARKWKTHWPVPGEKREVPLTLADVPRGWWGPVSRATSWGIWPVGSVRQPLTIGGPVLYYPHCQTNIGLRSSYRSTEPIPPPTQHHHPKDGIAIAGGTIPVEPITVLSEASPEWALIPAVIGDGFTRAEDAVRLGGDLQAARITDIQRRSTPTTLEVLCRSAGRLPGATIYYFEAVRRYAPLTLGQATFFWGFAHQDMMGKFAVYVYAIPTMGQMRDVTYTTPLAMIRVEDVPLWIVQRAGFGWEEYAVIDVSKTKPTTVIATYGGGC